MITHSAVTFGNSKLGRTVGAWSLPAGAAHTCPGETATCKALCYAKAGFFRMPRNIDILQKNKDLAESENFAAWITAKISSMCVNVVRVHVSGDFYSPDYIRKWVEVAQNLKNVQFYAYTRSWRVEELLIPLLKLGAVPNMQLWWSMDRDDSAAPYIAGIRRAYLAVDDADAAAAPKDADLIFRDNTKTVLKKGNSVMVCPAENGVQLATTMTCAKCRFCWSDRDPRWETVLQPKQICNTSVTHVTIQADV